MKFGETLRQRSIPQWQAHNVDYNDVKQFIRANTIDGCAKPIDIPGSVDGATDTSTKDFEQKVAEILKEQNERISLFVWSKVGEIQRRLAHLAQQLDLYTTRPSSSSGSKSSVRRTERYSRTESEILKVGEEIRCLSRYIGVQTEAFRKLIKKYKKWTGSAGLDNFMVTISGNSNFISTDLRPFLERYEALLDMCRTLYEDLQKKDKNGQAQLRSSDNNKSEISLEDSAEIRRVLNNGSRVEFDHLVTQWSEKQESCRKAVFWVHSSNIVELQILLLQFVRSYNSTCRQSSMLSMPGTPHDSSTNTSNASASTFQVVADGPSRDAPPLLHIKGSIRDDTCIVSWTDTGSQNSCEVRRKFLNPLLMRSKNVMTAKLVPQVEQSEDNIVRVDAFRAWYETRNDVQPLCTLLSQRSRLFSLDDLGSGARLAVLDNNVSFAPGLTIDKQDDEHNTAFPHGVLEIYQIGQLKVDLISLLKESHLVEQVQGFSLEQHALWTMKKNNDMKKPNWLPLLAKDIRKLPKPVPTLLRRPSAEFPSQSTTPNMSVTTLSEIGNLEDTPRHKRHAINRQTSQLPTLNESQRYWNEYDNPEEDDRSEYMIYVDPGDSTPIWDRLWTPFRGLFSRESTSTQLPTHHNNNNNNAETDPLLYSARNKTLQHQPADPVNYESSDEDDDNFNPSNHLLPRNNSRHRYPSHNRSPSQNRFDSLLKDIPRSSIICLIASFSILFIAFILASTGRRKLGTEVNAGVMFAAVMSLSFVFIAVLSLYTSATDNDNDERHLKGSVWAMAGICVVVMVVGNVGLLVWRMY